MVQGAFWDRCERESLLTQLEISLDFAPWQIGFCLPIATPIAYRAKGDSPPTPKSFNMMLIEWYRRIQLRHVVIALVCGCAFVRLLNFQYEVWREPPSPVASFIARYEPLRSMLPAGETIGFLCDKSHLTKAPADPDARLFLAQYALAPQPLVRWTNVPWVIVDSDCPEAVPKTKDSSRWTLLGDLQNGVRLYRTGQPLKR
jgi:hypothetical protein